MQLLIKDVDADDWLDFAPRIREEDANEWVAAVGMGPGYLADAGWLPPLTDPRAKSVCRMASDPDGTPLCIWGVSKMTDGLGWVWLVATPECVPRARFMHKYLFGQLQEFRDLYPLGLATESWIGNPIHHMWLNWLGFEPGPKITRNGGIFITHELPPGKKVKR